MGGTCVIRGCVPKKLMVFASGFPEAIEDARASQVQFRYLFVTSARGLQVVDITDYGKPVLTEALIPLADAQKLHVARTYAYVAAGAEGLAIINVTNPEQPKLYQMYTQNNTFILVKEPYESTLP